MKKPATITGVMLLGYTATACGGNDADAQNWFAENCPAQISHVTEADDPDAEALGENEGQTVEQAVSQGAVRPPQDIDDSTLRIGLYEYDELSETMTQEGEVSADDVFCFEQSLIDRRMTFRGNEIEGDIDHPQDVWFMEMRSPEHPEGIWVSERFSLGQGSIGGWDTAHDWSECTSEWVPATDITPLDEAGDGDSELSSATVSQADDC